MQINIRSKTFLPKLYLIFIFLLTYASGYVFGTSFSWSKSEVKPVVFCRFDSMRGFVPVGSDSIGDPSWRKEEVTPVVQCRYDNFFQFIPKEAEASVMTPGWKKEEVQPWVEVPLSNLD